MAYRYTNTDKWDDAWFANLKPIEKLLFIYLCDNCDIAGFIEVNIKKWSSDIGSEKKIIEGALKGLGRGLMYSDLNDCIYIRNYLKHQKNLPLNAERNQAHKGIIKRFELYQYKFKIENIIDFIEGACKGLGSPYGNGNGNGNGKKAQIFDFSFVNPGWLSIFTEWIDYKKSIKDNYTTQKSLEACYRNLQTLSQNDLIRAKKIIDQSMGNKWKGLFPLKESLQKQFNSDVKVSTKYIDEYESNRK